MKNTRHRERGFTLVEMLIVLAILGIALLLAAPYLSKQLQRSKVVGVAQQAAGLMRLARMDAIRTSRCSMVLIDPAGRRVEVLSDRDDNCQPTAPDERVSELVLPSGVAFASPCGADADSIRGLTTRVGLPSMAVFRGDGSARDPGALRFQARELGGRAPNYLEVILSPAATARVQVRKWRGADGGDCNDDTLWHANGDGGSWKWS